MFRRKRSCIRNISGKKRFHKASHFFFFCGVSILATKEGNISILLGMRRNPIQKTAVYPAYPHQPPQNIRSAMVFLWPEYIIRPERSSSRPDYVFGIGNIAQVFRKGKSALEKGKPMGQGPFPQPHPQSAPGTPHHREWVLPIDTCRKDTRNREPDCHFPLRMFARLFRDKPP